MTRTKTMGGWSGVAIMFGALGLLPSSPAFAASDSEPIMEEVVVTGSFIQRDTFSTASPITVVDQAEISNNATPNLGEVLVNQTFNYGTDFQTNTFAARSQIGTVSSANLRGLGANATLDLIDGQRANGNLNTSLPQIAIQRIDILKDGASAIYGSDAVAGAVNLITRKNFVGTEFDIFATQDDDNDLDEQQYEALFGADTDDGHITVALSYKTRGELQQVERPNFMRNGFERSGTGNPGTWRVPVRDVDGNIVGSEVLRDPGCGVATAASPGGTDVAKKGNFLSGDPRSVVEMTFGLPAGATGGAEECGFHFGETWNYMNPQKQTSIWVNFRHQFNESFSNELDFQATRLKTDSRGSPQNPGGRTEEFPIVPGEHPGNPFRAQNADGAPLFAQDANGDGIPDRGDVDANGDGLPDVIVAGTDPGSGIPFSEDVDVVALRIFGKIGLLPGANQPTGLNRDGSNLGNATFDTINYRVWDKLTWFTPYNGWEVSLTGLFQQTNTELQAKNTSQNALEAGLRGELVVRPEADPVGAAGPRYWNPFSTQALQCENRVCDFTGTPDFANEVATLDAVNLIGQDITNTDFWLWKLVGTGDVFELPAGTLQSAFGMEFRRRVVDTDLNSARNRCDFHEGGCGFDWNGDRDVWSGFYEILIPVHETLEVTAAGRWEGFGGGIGNDFSPKFSFLWQPIDLFTGRGSFTEAFIAPTIEQQFESEDCGLQTMQDDLTRDESATFRVACVSGNPNLKPETADIFNFGFTFNLLDGDLQLGADYVDFDFSDRISVETGNNVLRANFAAFQAAGGQRCVEGGAGPTCGVPDSDGDGLSDDVEAWIATQEDDVFRDSTGVVTRVITERLNATTIKHTAIDLHAAYRFSFRNFGDFAVNVDATYLESFKFDLGTGDPRDRGDGAGKQNEQVAEVPPAPEWRVNGTLNWFLGNHSARIRTRFIDAFELEFNSGGLQTLDGILNGDPSVDSIFYTDVNYSYTFDRLVTDGATTVTIGANNIFDEFPDPFFNLGGIETFVHDIRGRMWYLRINQTL